MKGGIARNWTCAVRVVLLEFWFGGAVVGVMWSREGDDMG